MTLETQVTSLEISKKLFFLGIKQESLFYYTEKDDCLKLGYGTSIAFVQNDLIYYPPEFNSYSAFTASEIMDMLPDRIILREGEPFNCFRFYLYRSIVVEEGTDIYPTFIINYVCDTYELPELMERRFFEHNVWDKTLPDALGKTLIYMIENKIDPIVFPLKSRT